MKLHWGHYIILSFVFFAAFILYLVYRSSQYTVDLVSEDYYQRELDFQQQLDKMNNAASHKVQLHWSDSTLILEFPDTTDFDGAHLRFMRPSDSRLDRKWMVADLQHARKIVPLSSLKTGLYTLSIEWSDTRKAYYQEEQIMIP
ncbi:MAG: FixH family protein [Cytophagaceae bacterium]|jgi:hypothetical protein|nr:FixH family protein [Cytophagaceae bacterium]